MVLPEDHPAVVEGRPLFQKNPHGNRLTGRVLMSGVNQRKLGSVVTKGKWRGFPIFSLTLEERTTCPRSCEVWRSCYGNHSPWSVRHKATPETLSKIVDELSDFQSKYPRGFVVRLHLLGDFMSIEYVAFWALCLNTFSALRIFGYTARSMDDEIGMALQRLITSNWSRFAIRSSGGVLPDVPSSKIIDSLSERGEAIVCAAQHSKNPDSVSCGSCALCWATRRPIAFLRH